jgi:hypothetical protein
MGLDQYAYKTSRKPPKKHVDFDGHEDAEEFFYWRKHRDLQTWMEKLYRAKGGAQEHFNCARILLTVNDLDSLESDLRQRPLPKVDGTLFSGDDIEQDLDFVWAARRAIADGYTVYYYSWW